MESLLLQRGRRLGGISIVDIGAVRGRSDGQLSRSEWLFRVRASLHDGSYSQVPQLETEATVRAARAGT